MKTVVRSCLILGGVLIVAGALYGGFSIRPPQAVDDEAATTVDTPVVIDVLANDVDLDGEPLQVDRDSLVQPANGVVLVSPDLLTVTYTPAPGFVGADTFWYFANDGQFNSLEPAMVTVTVVAAPEEPAGNQPPDVTSVAGPATACEVGADIAVSGLFTDPNPGDTHTATWDWGDGQTSDGAVDEAAGQVTGEHTYAAAGLYLVRLTVADAAGASDSAEYAYVVVYDRRAGFVTGGGWFHSPAGAVADRPTWTGKAHFTVGAAYGRGASVPSGQAAFWLNGRRFQFEAHRFQWLVVSGRTAWLMGTGKLNGQDGYGCLFVLRDGPRRDGTGDRVRVRLWRLTDGSVVYDSQLGDPDAEAPALSIRGDLSVHKAGRS